MFFSSTSRQGTKINIGMNKLAATRYSSNLITRGVGKSYANFRPNFQNHSKVARTVCHQLASINILVGMHIPDILQMRPQHFFLPGCQRLVTGDPSRNTVTWPKGLRHPGTPVSSSFTRCGKGKIKAFNTKSLEI